MSYNYLQKYLISKLSTHNVSFVVKGIHLPEQTRLQQQTAYSDILFVTVGSTLNCI